MASFEELQALAEVVSKNKVKHIQVIGNPGNANTKFEQFYDAIATGRLHDDTEAAQCFYQTSPDHAAYRKLKDRLQERLVNTLFFVDVNQEGFNDYNKGYYNCYKLIAATKILIGRAARKAAIPLAEKALEQAIKFEFTDVILFLARDLRMHYGSIVGDRKKFETLDILVEQYNSILLAELKAEQYYSNLMMHYVGSKATKPDLIEKAAQYSTELEKLSNKINSYRFNYLSFVIFTLRHEIANDYLNTLEVCQKAIR